MPGPYPGGISSPVRYLLFSVAVFFLLPSTPHGVANTISEKGAANHMIPVPSH